jgi:cob(I)alamin adenosyltransferase
VKLEALIDRLEAELDPLTHFLLPGGCPEAAALHVCRTVCRRAERRVVALGRETHMNPAVLVFLNRLSDALFVMARWVNARRGAEETPWRGTR